MTAEIGFENLAFRLARNRLRKSHLFKGLPDEEIDRIAGLFETLNLAAGDRLFKEGDPGDSFFFLLNGRVMVTHHQGEEEELISTLTAGDFFGEGALLFGNPRRASVTAIEDTALLQMRRDDFALLLQNHPEIKQELVIVSHGYDIAGRKRFDWLAEDESLHLVTRKHPIMLVFAQVPVALIFFGGIFLLYYGSQIGMNPLAYSGIAVAAGAILWGIWRYIDWGDDYYIVTDKRVVWLEETLLLYESIQEAQLVEVRSVDISTDLLQRIFGYGDLHVRTYTGNIVMRDIPQPERFKALIEEYWQRALIVSRQMESMEVDNRLREKLGLPVGRPGRRRPPPSIEPKRSKRAEERPVTQTIFTNFLKMRYVEGDKIVYRKHWFILLGTIWPPTLGLILLLSGGVYVLANFPNEVFNLIFTVSFISLLGWWIYKYWDWRDDRYELTRVDITDLDRTPLGRENRQTAPLENILSLEHEREGFLGIVFNFGTVSINVGDKTYVFEGVHNPARVRQEVSDRQQSRRKQVERDRSIRDEERQLDWLARYHRNARELWEQPEEEELEEDGFELE
ncbi:MAG TPA: cyclic nucleotide-binding domain-containing protein [Anaerolineales bacterium]|nr:cyclic nucleotide-binding domain-containing protein [Anaerolineales bacterium]